MEITLKITDEEKAATLLALFALLDFVEVLPPAGEEEKNALTSQEDFLLSEEQEIPPLTASLIASLPEEEDTSTLTYKEMRDEAFRNYNDTKNG